MFEDTTLTIVLLVMIALMVVGLIGVRKLNQGTRKIEEENKAYRANESKTAQPG